MLGTLHCLITGGHMKSREKKIEKNRPSEVLLHLHGEAIGRGALGGIDDVHRVKAARSDVDDPGPTRLGGLGMV